MVNFNERRILIYEETQRMETYWITKRRKGLQLNWVYYINRNKKKEIEKYKVELVILN